MNEQNENSNQELEKNQANEPDIQPSEPENNEPKIGNQSSDPGRTPGKAEGSRETVEENLEQKNSADKNE